MLGRLLSSLTRSTGSRRTRTGGATRGAGTRTARGGSLGSLLGGLLRRR